MAKYFTSGYTPPGSIASAEDVRALQQQLNASGANLKVDGIYGPLTASAYNTYNQQQKSQGIIDSLKSYAPGAGIGAAFDAAGQHYKSALDASYESTKTGLNAQANKLAGQFDALRGQAYTNTRLSAVGNNEALAARGLAGNLYDDARSGVSETSRVAQDVGMRNDINLANRQETEERDRIALELIQSGYTKDIEYARWMADMQLQKAAAEQAASQAAFQNMLSVAGLELNLLQSQAPLSSGSGHSSSGQRSGSSGGGDLYNQLRDRMMGAGVISNYNQGINQYLANNTQQALAEGWSLDEIRSAMSKAQAAIG